MNRTRCEEVIVQLAVRTYNESGDLVNVQASQPMTVCRNAETRDFWVDVVDKSVAAMTKVTTS